MTSIFTNDYDNEIFREYILEDNDLIGIEKILMQLNVKAKVSDTPIGSYGINCRKSCEAGKKFVSVDSKGDVYPCHMLNGINKFKNCEYKYLCGGGCRGRSYLKHGNLLEKNAYCTLNYKYYKNLIENII